MARYRLQARMAYVMTDCSTICEKLHSLAARLAGPAGPVQIMEICGTHTMSVARNGLRGMLPSGLRLVSGPGCPVCVTDQGYIDRAVSLAEGAYGQRPIVATYGDMVRVPGERGSLAEARARGAEVEVVYSADQAVELAQARRDRQVVFLAVGFETTAPATALAVLRARREGLSNFTVLAAHKLVVPAMRALLEAGDVRIDGFLCPGHVSVILGWRAYGPIVEQYHRPCVVAGFEPQQILLGLEAILRQMVEGEPKAETVYAPVSPSGNPSAKKVLEDVFRTASAKWRALGVIPDSGLELKAELASFDAARRFDLPAIESADPAGCRCGDVICGRCLPADCPLFATRCTVRDPVGPCMVSSEGACAAAFKYERHGLRAGAQDVLA